MPLWKQILNSNPISMAGEAVAPLWQKILQPQQPQPIQSTQPLWKRILGEPFQGAESIVPLAQKTRALTRQYIDKPFERITQPIEQSYMQKFNISPEQMAQIKPKAELAITSVMGETTPLKFLKGASKFLSKTDDLKPLISEAKKYKSATEYAMSHRPTKGSPAYDISKGGYIPKDVYSNPEYYANMKDKNYQESFEILKKIKDNPEMEVTIYRASPKNELNSGDWVSFSKGYAKQESLTEKTPVHAFKVKAKDVYFAGDDLNEFGYFPTEKLSINDEAMQTLRVIENNFSKGGMSKYVYNLAMKNEINRLLKLGYSREQIPDIFYKK